MNKYFKNFILCGDSEHYCLLCQELFHGVVEVEKHIRWEKHRKAIKTQAYLPKFKRDCIYKVANHYYCEVCNLVFSDVLAVTEHINKETHKTEKNNPKIQAKNFIGQYDSGCIVINKVILNTTQWNSIVDKKCLLCNIRVQNIDEHTASEDHIIRLIQSETKYDDARYYRKINDDKYHCFTCKKVFTAEIFNDHWSSCEHTDEVEIKKIKESGSNKTLTENITKMANLEKKLIKTLQDFFYIEDNNDFSTCKSCSTVVPINFKAMIEHMKSQHDKDAATVISKTNYAPDESADNDVVVYVDIVDNGKRRSELAQYGKAHSIKLNFNGSKGWCMLCGRYMSAHINIFKEHVKGVIHRGHLELQGLKNPKKCNAGKYKLKNVLQYKIKYLLQEHEFWVNDDYCIIDGYSFFLLHPILNDAHFKKTKCYACNELFPQGQERDHCMNPKHKNNFMAAKLVEFNEILHAEDFIREIRPNLFHCGFCNQTYPYLEPLAHHLMDMKHNLLKIEKTQYCLTATIDIISRREDIAYMQLVNYALGFA